MILDFCAVCGLDGDAFDLHQHHFVPRSKGGSDDETNLLTLCNDCHRVIHGQKKTNGASHSQLILEGQARAKAKGKVSGRKSKLTVEQRQEVKQRLEDGESKVQLSKEYGVSRATILNIEKGK